MTRYLAPYALQCHYCGGDLRIREHVDGCRAEDVKALLLGPARVRALVTALEQGSVPIAELRSSGGSGNRSWKPLVVAGLLAVDSPGLSPFNVGQPGVGIRQLTRLVPIDLTQRAVALVRIAGGRAVTWRGNATVGAMAIAGTVAAFLLAFSAVWFGCH